MGKKSISMKAIIIVSFLVFIVTVLIICLTLFVNWKASADNILIKVENNIKEDILKEIEAFVNIPLHINEVYYHQIKNRIVDLNNNTERERFFSGVLKAHSNEVYSFSYGTENGEYYGARRNAKNGIEVMKNNAETGGHSWYYSAKEDLTAGEFVLDAGRFDVRTREWYIIAKEKQKPGFSPAYKHFVMEDMAISAVYPVFNENGTLNGVLGTHITLSKLNGFLEQIAKENKADAYILEEDTGLFVANTVGLPVYKTMEDNKYKRISIRETSRKYLAEVYESYISNQKSSYTIKAENDRLHINVSSYRKAGLNWLVITSVPESQFTSEISDSIIITIIVAVIAFILMTIIYVRISSIVLKPIYNLIRVTEDFSSGNLSTRARLYRNDEIGKLSQAFNKMAEELLGLINGLEDKVKERTSELEKANQAKRDFLAVMSHEVRTPMNGIIGSIQFLESSGLDNEQQKLINAIKISADTLLTVTNEILDFSKIEAGRLELEAISFSIKSIVESAVYSYAAKAEDNGLKLLLSMSPDIPESVIGDPTKLRQVIGNLVSNGVKFTETGQVSVAVCVKNQNQTAIEFLFTVSDTGIGMSEQEMDRIFEPFLQADLSSTRKYGGTGLGLSICKKIIEKMGGKINVYSKKGEGTCFNFTVILEKAGGKGYIEYTNGWVPASLEAEDPVIEDHIKPKILLAEDNDINRQLFIKLLDMKGLNCDVAANGQEAVRAFSEKPYDLIFMDCQMPIMDGYEATRRIRQAGGSKKQPVIVAITSYAMKGDAEKCFEAGMNEYLSKPVDFAQVINIIHRYGSIKKAEPQRNGTLESSEKKFSMQPAAMDKLLTDILHDIRGPLSSVVSLMDILDEESYSDDNREIILAVRKQVTKAFSALQSAENNLLNQSKILGNG